MSAGLAAGDPQAGLAAAGSASEAGAKAPPAAGWVLIAGAGTRGQDIASQLRAQPARGRQLRSMAINAERATGPVLAHEYDSRITSIGRPPRRAGSGGVSQFWNALRGEMSAAGPRPERPEYAERIPGYAHRVRVRPGIAGLAQVHSGCLTSVYDRLRCDRICRWRRSVGQQESILLLTTWTVLRQAGT